MLKYLLVFSLALTGCSYYLPKEECRNVKRFNYDDKVKVTKGFFTGKNGIVFEELNQIVNNEDEYCISAAYRVLLVTSSECSKYPHSCPHEIFSGDQLEKL